MWVFFIFHFDITVSTTEEAVLQSTRQGKEDIDRGRRHLTLSRQVQRTERMKRRFDGDPRKKYVRLILVVHSVNEGGRGISTQETFDDAFILLETAGECQRTNGERVV